MKRELEEQLTKKYPLLYRDIYKNPRSTCMAFGCDCGNGWYDLLDELSSKLEPLIEKYISTIEEPRCVCGELPLEHEDGIRKCLKTYRVPLKWKALDIWGKFCVSGEIYDSKKLKDRIYVKWKRLKSNFVHKINVYLNRLCYWDLLYKTIPSWCKNYSLSHPAASQVKEKFALLRFYMTSSTDEMQDLIDEYENKSASVCEDCGSLQGKLRNGGWLRTLCDGCDDLRK